MPVLPSWLAQPLWDQFAALLPTRETYVSTHPWGCHRRRIPDRIVFNKLVQMLRFGCSYQDIADSACSATALRTRRDEWIELGLFAHLKQIALDAYHRIVVLVLEEISVDGCITKAPGGGEVAGPLPVDRRKQGMKRSLMVEATASRWAESWPAPTGTTRHCWRRRWTCSTTSAHSPTTSPCTLARRSSYAAPPASRAPAGVAPR